jgi:aspartate-semialdehyde dehydrogenase
MPEGVRFNMNKIPVGILGATGMVGQRFITLLKNNPWFEVVCVAASPRSAGKLYAQVVAEKWLMQEPIPEPVSKLTVLAVEKDARKIASQVKFVFSALDLEKERIKEIENNFAFLGVIVVSNNSAHRLTKDVPMIIPEINPEHLALIEIQKRNHEWKNGFIVTKPNCSIQSFVPQISALMDFNPQKIDVTTFQAVSGAGKTLEGWPEMKDNVIPFIGGEEEKTENEPLKIWGVFKNGKIEFAKHPTISATCIRVPVSNGHLASVAVSFKNKPTKNQILKAWKDFNPLSGLGLPSAPNPFITVFDEDNRPQTNLDRNLGNGMGISAGRLRDDRIFDYKFVGLSHNTIRGAAGGAILMAELLRVKGYI